MKSTLLFIVATLLILCVIPGYAGTTGKIAGEIKDSQTGEALIGVNVVAEGTSMGAATNIDGVYAILNIPPGKYNLVISAVGYHRQTIAGVSVSIDQTTTIDVKLVPTVIDVGEEVVVTAERPLVQKDLTAKTAVIEGDEIKALPVTEIGQVLSLQAGNVGGHVRGGRAGEVAYWIDGVPVTDAYDGGQVVEVNKSLVQELQLVSGAFNAEYGQAMSAIVNIATREGGPKFAGGAGTYFGDYASNHTSVFPGINKVNPFNIRDFEGNLSGPIVGGDLTFFANGRYIYFNGWEKGYRKYNPDNVSYTDAHNVFHLYRDSTTGRGDSSLVPMNWSKRAYGQGKLAWHVTPVIKATLNFIYDDNTAKAYNNQYFFNPDGIGNNYTKSYTAIVQISHSLNQSTFYTVGGSWFNRDLRYYVYESPSDLRYTHPNLLYQVDAYSLYSGGTDLNRFHRYTTTVLGKIDLSSQVNESNLVKVGVEVRRHSISYESYALQPDSLELLFFPALSSPFIHPQIPSDTSLFYSSYLHHPVEISAYVQDKLEFKDFILNIGVRFDYFQPDAHVLNDDPNHYTVDDPNIYSPVKDENKNTPLQDRFAYWYKKASAKYQVSPRIGASFPITERGVVHFSYGHFFQIPQFENLYTNPDFKIGFGTGNQGLIGNADLKPEQTISAEVGVNQQLSDDISLDLTGYFRDIRNLTSTSGDQINVYGGSRTYSKYVNRDFGSVKGIILTVEKRFGGGFSSKLDYTYQVARGSGSDPQEYRNAVLGGKLPDVQLFPLQWDQRHTVNVSVNYAAKRWGASMIGQYGSGFPYTPQSTQDISALLTNSGLKPASFDIDLQTYFEFPLDPLRLVAFIRVFNLLDDLNQLSVYNDSGLAGYTKYRDLAIQQRTLQAVNSIDDFYRRPDWYSEPRRIEFGLNLEF